MKSIALRTYAKINISLDVTGIRSDGYHEVAMVMQAIDLYDEMRVKITPSDKMKITLKTDKYYIPKDQRNTAYKAAKIMMDRYMTTAPQTADLQLDSKIAEGSAVQTAAPSDNKGAASPAACGCSEIRIDIKKNIPVAAGLAGGSSNAAGVLMALNLLLETGLSLDELCEIGTEIGADVPFCIMSLAALNQKLGVSGGATCALAEGIGEVLTPLPSVSMWAVLAKPPIGVSTPAVYKALDAVAAYVHPDTETIISGIKTNNMTKIKDGMENVLEVVTLHDYPEVQKLKDRMLEYNPDMTMMSGSGPTVFSLFSNRRKAEAEYNALKAFEKKGYAVFCIKAL